MKRRVQIKTGVLTVNVNIDTKNMGLMRDEVEQLRDDVADKLMQAVTNIKFCQTPLNRVKVS